MKAITLYQTSDGKTFEVESEASAHQAGIDNKARIDAFIDRHYPKVEGAKKAGPTRSIAAKVLAQWLAEQAAAE